MSPQSLHDVGWPLLGHVGLRKPFLKMQAYPFLKTLEVFFLFVLQAPFFTPDSVCHCVTQGQALSL